jgi:hypothetical protein
MDWISSTRSSRLRVAPVVVPVVFWSLPLFPSAENLSYPIFMPKPSTHRMHDPGSIIPHIRPKVLTDNQMS